MKASATYVYGVVEGSPPGLEQIPALPDAGPPRWLPLDDSFGLLVASAPGQAFGESVLEKRMQDVDWVSACALAHDAAVEAAARASTIVPLRMFTLFRDDERAREAMQKRRGELQPLLDRLRGRDEWGVRIQILPPPRAPAEKPATGTAFLAGKVKSKQDKVERARAARALAAEAREKLSILADDMAQRDAAPEGATNPPLLDAAFLVPRAGAARFRKEAAALARKAEGQHLRLTLSGPWPAYSFAGGR